MDPSEVQVTEFKVTEAAASEKGHLYSIMLSARWADAPAIHRHVEKKVAGYEK
ncbi:hypothetical protein AwEntero_00610 [Enterobacterales bacterium]|nr:hypothetical protein AwEntero_00610 [Enterobacterales bacterium]